MILELKKISKGFGGVRTINKTSFSVSEDKVFTLIDPNGTGKMTLFSIITGNYKPTSGEVLFKGQRIDTLRPHKIIHCGIARTFQDIRLFSSMNMLESALIGFNNQMEYSILGAFLHLEHFSRVESEFKDRAYILLKELKLGNVAYHKATSLSYGQQRKVEVARAMATNPSLLLLDEPAAGMNDAESGALADPIFGLREDYEMNILLVEYDTKFVNRLYDKVLVLDYGKAIFEGKLNDTTNRKGAVATYLGGFNADC